MFKNKGNIAKTVIRLGWWRCNIISVSYLRFEIKDNGIIKVAAVRYQQI